MAVSTNLVAHAQVLEHIGQFGYRFWRCTSDQGKSKDGETEIICTMRIAPKYAKLTALK